MRMGAESQVKLPQAEDASMARRPAEAGKGAGSSPALPVLRRSQPCLHLGLDLPASGTVRTHFRCLSHSLCAILPQPPQETNTPKRGGIT